MIDQNDGVSFSIIYTSLEAVSNYLNRMFLFLLILWEPEVRSLATHWFMNEADEWVRIENWLQILFSKECLHLEAALIEDYALMLFIIYSSFIVSWSRCEQLLCVLRLLFKLFNREAFDPLQRWQILLKDVDLAVRSHHNEDSLRLILLEHTDRRHFVRRTHHEHYFGNLVLLSLLSIVSDLKRHLLASLADCC